MPFDALPPQPADFLTPITPACVEMVADRYQLHPDILFAVLLVEQGTVGKDNCHNGNGTCDIGPAQINDIHLPALQEAGITRELLKNNGCVNLAVMGWHLQRSLQDQPIESEDDYLTAIARYHSKSPEFNERYRQRLKEAFRIMYEVQP